MKQIFISILLVLSTSLKAQSIQEIDSLLLGAYERDQKVRTESSQLRGVADVKFFMFRLAMLYT